MPSEPAFTEPWQAGALALVQSLVDAGHLSAAAWSETLGAEIRARREAGGPDDGSDYYDCVVSAVERMVTERGLADRALLDQRRFDWRDAFARTPHGEPVVLERQG